MANFKLSDQQQAVINFATKGQGSLNLVARAGCGKTSTLLELVPFLDGEIFIGAYNTKIAEEISTKLQARGIPQRKCFASTMHRCGAIAWYRKAKGCKLDEDKMTKILDTFISEEDAIIFGGAILKAVSLAKQRAFGFLCAIEDQTKWFDLIDHFGIEEDLPEDEFSMEHFVSLCIGVYKESLRLCYHTIDFDDMILAPLYFKVFMYPKDWVLIDEAQDTNPARRALALKMLRPRTGRLIAVGDDRQAIYGFTGADSDSMELIKEQLNSSVLPLNKTFRCPKSVVRLAQKWVPDIEAADSNPEGVVRSVWLTPQTGQPAFWQESFTKEDAILCRNTKPLVELAYAFLRKGIACKVEGRKIGEGLIALINRWKVVKITALLNKLTEYQAKEVQKYLAKGKEDKAQAIEDKCETIAVLAQRMQEEGKHNISDLVAFINSLFGDTPEGQKAKVLTLSTIHKSKGREWPRVYMVGMSKYLPSKYARKEWQLAQESNLCYVGVTRAMQEYIDVVVQ